MILKVEGTLIEIHDIYIHDVYNQIREKMIHDELIDRFGGDVRYGFIVDHMSELVAEVIKYDDGEQNYYARGDLLSSLVEECLRKYGYYKVL